MLNFEIYAMMYGFVAFIITLDMKCGRNQFPHNISFILHTVSVISLHFFQEEMVNEFNESGVDPLTVSLYQMDLDRTVFLLRSYLRTRLQKVTSGFT